MQAQAYEGYVESGQFYPKKIPIHLSGRFRAVLTVLDVPVQATTISSSRIEWLNRLEAAVALSAEEDLPDWPFERSKKIHPPLDLTD
jgi:hypothetical protein